MTKSGYILLITILSFQSLLAQDFNGFNTVLRTNRLTTAPYYVGIDYPSTLPGLIARYRADSLETIYDDSGRTKKKFPQFHKKTGIVKQCKNAAQEGFELKVFQWLDITGNNNHLTAYDRYRTTIDPDASASYTFSTVTDPNYQTNAKVIGDGFYDHLYKDIDPNLEEDFTFIFVMRATNPNPGGYNSFIASSSHTSQDSPNGPSRAGAWQISTNTDTNNLYFGYCEAYNGATHWLPLINFDTQVHVYYIEYDFSEKKVTISVDGLTKVSHTVSPGRTGPIIDELRLFRNRNMDTYIAAEFNEFFLADRLFTDGEKLKVTNYLISKWGVSL